MTLYERSQQLWSVLALAAKNRQILTYEHASRITGLPRPAIGQNLDPIQAYCMQHNLPPLTILVVQQETGIPGDGFIAAQDIPAAQQKVFSFDWYAHGCPSAEIFENVEK